MQDMQVMDLANDFSNFFNGKILQIMNYLPKYTHNYSNSSFIKPAYISGQIKI